jgi:hypothetical protein
MIRLILALGALLALHDALALDMLAVNSCVSQATGYVCPDLKGNHPSNKMKRVMTRDQALVYCECRLLTEWDNEQAPLCLALSRACEYGDL